MEREKKSEGGNEKRSNEMKWSKKGNEETKKNKGKARKLQTKQQSNFFLSLFRIVSLSFFIYLSLSY
jgi:hypothetical protein